MLKSADISRVLTPTGMCLIRIDWGVSLIVPGRKLENPSPASTPQRSGTKWGTFFSKSFSWYGMGRSSSSSSRSLPRRHIFCRRSLHAPCRKAVCGLHNSWSSTSLLALLVYSLTTTGPLDFSPVGTWTLALDLAGRRASRLRPRLGDSLQSPSLAGPARPPPSSPGSSSR